MTRLGDALLAQGALNADQLRAALAEQQVTGERLGAILLREGLVSRAALSAALGQEVGETQRHESMVPPLVLLQTRSRIVTITPSTAVVATASPRVLAREVLARYFPGRDLVFQPYNIDELDDYLDDLAAGGAADPLDHLIRDAFRTGASDIHLVPRAKSYSVLMRQLGVRRYIREGSLEEYNVLAARIKDKAGMDIAERRVPQDGAWRYELAADQVLDLRVATIPTLTGETIVLRVLDQTAVALSLDSMGITRVEEWRSGFSRPDGLCLVCGPTGSGKTSLLNATVREMDYFGRAVYSAEDPVEYRLPFVSQVNVNSLTGLTFARAVQSFMRADPDVIMIGEIRDRETAHNAMRAAETGHLVLATLHTESVTGAVRRLTDLGVEGYMLKPLLRAVIAQRLIRVACRHCAGEGCSECHGVGYTGRTAVSECAEFPTEQAVEAMMGGQVTWPTMLDDARAKLRQGLTSQAELQRVFGRHVHSE